MTEIIYTTKDHHMLLKLHGHADYDPGHDIVCASISTITYGFANYLDDAQTRGKITNLRFRDTPGDMVIEFDLVNFNEWPEICDLVMTYYQMLSENFPNNVFCQKVGHIV